MIPEHLKKYDFKPSFFYKMKNGRFGINDEGVTKIAHQINMISQEATVQHLVTSENKTVCAVRICLRVKAQDNDIQDWEAVASSSTAEFEGATWEDRRKYHIAQMAMTRAKNAALSMAINMTDDDVQHIVEEIGFLDAKQSKRFGGAELDEVEPEPPEVEETDEEKAAKMNAMREKMKGLKKG
jgi:hypothetical protein